MSSGVKYIGEFKSGMQHGQGKIYLPDDPDNSIVGVWNEGEMQE